MAEAKDIANGKFELALNQIQEAIRKGQIEEVRDLAEQLVASETPNPHQYLANFYCAVISQKMDRKQQMQIMLRRSLRLEPEYKPAINLMRQVINISSSIEIMEKALLENPGNGELLSDLAIFYEVSGNKKRALECISKILKTNYMPTASFLNHFALLGGEDAASLNWAIRVLEFSLKLYPREFVLYNNLSGFHIRKGDNKKALELIDKAIDLKPKLSILHFRKARIFTNMKLYSEAADAAKQSIDLNPKSIPAYNLYLNALLFLAEWDVVNAVTRNALAQINKIQSSRYEDCFNPFLALALPIKMDEYVEIARRQSRNLSTQNKFKNYKKHSKNKIRIAYLSPDLTRDHPVGLLVDKIFGLHNSRYFETFAFATRYYRDTDEIVEGVDRFESLFRCSQKEKIQKIHDAGVDILIDLAGYTDAGPQDILAYQLAPVQIQYLGYTSSMQADWIQYYLSCEPGLPAAFQKWFSEKIIYMPEGSYSTFPKAVPDVNLQRSEYGLPEDSVVFCCFNSSQRIDEEVFAVWLNILKNVPASVLWLKNFDEVMKNNLNRLIRRAGIELERIVYLDNRRLTEGWHHQLADLYLDTFRMSSGTGAVLSAQIGLPVLTLAGETPQSRIGACVAAAANAEELVCHSVQEYQERAIDLGRHPDKLVALKEKLLKDRDSMPLFNPERFVRHLEKAYQSVWQNYLDGKAPETIYVEKLP